MGYKLLSQIALIIFSFVIIFTFIKPKFVDISVVQDELFQYSDAVAKAEEFNRLLRELKATENSFSGNEMAALGVFLPTKIDQAQVMNDIENIANQTGVIVADLTAGDYVVPVDNVVFENDPDFVNNQYSYQDFNLSVSSSYEDFKNFLSILEANAYPLEVVVLELSGEGETNSNSPLGNLVLDDSYGFSMTLRVFALSVQ